jgi:hypothetical protein
MRSFILNIGWLCELLVLAGFMKTLAWNVPDKLVASHFKKRGLSYDSCSTELQLRR